jgi:hypothetical protein
MRPPREDTEPWYKQFWPWFLIALPASVVVASIVTINLAIESDDGLVSDDYYKEGLAIHKDADSAARAQALGIAGTLRYDADTGAVSVMLAKPLEDNRPALSLEVVHPTLPDQDQTIRLSQVDGTRFAGRLEPLGPAQWKLSLRPADRSWRVEGRLPQPGSGETRLD